MAVFAPPFHAGVERQHAGLDGGRGEHRAVGEVARVLGRLDAQQFFADARVHAVRADDDVGFLGRAVGKVHHHHVAAVLDPGQALAVGHDAVGQGVDQQRMEVTAVHGQVGGAVVLDGVVAQRDLCHHVAGLPVAAVPVVGVRALRVECVLDADAAQDLHHVGPDVDARSQAREARRLFVDTDVEALLEQQLGGGSTAETGADHGDTGGLGHLRTPCGILRGIGRSEGLCGPLRAVFMPASGKD
ncbi:hypothetical protein D3C78_1019340 [compost metagenome]